MATLINFMFGVLVGAVFALFAINVLLVALKLAHRQAQAARISKATAPYISYFRLGGQGFDAGADGSKHA